MHISVGDADASRKEMKPQSAHFIQITHVPVSDRADAAQPLVDVSHHLAEKCPHAWRLIHVLQNEDARLWNVQNLFPRFVARTRTSRLLLRRKTPSHCMP